MKSHNRIPRSRILLVAVVVLLAVVICAELLAMRAMREKADASDVIQTLPEGDGETEPAAVDSAEPTDLRSPTESGETEPAAEGGSDPGNAGQSGASAGNNSPPSGSGSGKPSEQTEEIASGDISCDKFGMFSGQFVEDGASTFSIYLAPLTGYQYERAEGATFVPLASGDGSGFLRGEVGSGTSVTVWYKNTPRLARLNSLVAEKITAQGSYTDESWQVYQNALSAAQNFTVSSTTTQANVDAVVAALEQARSKLVAGSDATKVIEVVKLAASTPVGKQIALKITTTPNVEELSVEGVTMTLCTGKVQTLNTGDTVKIWLVYIPATTAGSYTYTIHAGSASAQVDVTVN